MQSAIIEFDNLQKSEQGSGRWLPKPSDTFNKFILMSKPSVGYKNIPLLLIL